MNSFPPVCGIVAEYNPFHSGHMFHIRRTRESLGGDAVIVCVMSGNFVQRGDFAVLDKYARAETAVRGGADLVLELPLAAALSSAEGFARGAVALLHGIGCRYLSFGAETADISLVQQAAEALNALPPAAGNRSGLSYAAYRQQELAALNPAAAALLAEDLLRRLAGTRDWRKDRRELQERMTGYAGHLRRMDKLDDAADAARNLLDAMYQEGYPFEDADHAVTNFHLAFASWVYLEAISFQAATGTGSRGSAAVLRPDGSIVPENPAFRGKVLETAATPQGVRVRWEPCRPFPETDGWFETVWAAYRNGTVYG